MNATTLNTIREVLDAFDDDALDRLDEHELLKVWRSVTELLRAGDALHDRTRRVLVQRALYPRRTPA